MTDLAEPPVRDLSDAHTAMPALKGRKAIISGGTTGIGRAIAVLLASEGAQVFICGRDPQHLREGLERIREVGKGDGIAVDLAEPEGVDKFVAAARAYFGDFDIAIVNAAIPAISLFHKHFSLGSDRFMKQFSRKKTAVKTSYWKRKLTKTQCHI